MCLEHLGMVNGECCHTNQTKIAEASRATRSVAWPGSVPLPIELTKCLKIISQGVVAQNSHSKGLVRS
jgi:hypothetical protein